MDMHIYVCVKKGAKSNRALFNRINLLWHDTYNIEIFYIRANQVSLLQSSSYILESILFEKDTYIFAILYPLSLGPNGKYALPDTRRRQCLCLRKACNVSFRPGIVSDARSRGHRVCTADARGMHNNVPRRRRVSRLPAHPRRRCSPVSRESNGRPLVKMLLFAYASRGSPRGPRSFIKFSVALDSDGVCVRKERGKIAAEHTLLQGV